MCGDPDRLVSNLQGDEHDGGVCVNAGALEVGLI